MKCYQPVENVARALYEAEEDGQSWEAEPEILKQEFRSYARHVLMLLDDEQAGLSAMLGLAGAINISEPSRQRISPPAS